jgi:hypothetical protein
MQFPIVLERHHQLLAIPIQLQAFEKLWTSLNEGTAKSTLEKLAHVSFTTVELIFSGAIEYLLNEIRQALEKTLTIVFKILAELGGGGRVRG